MGLKSTSWNGQWCVHAVQGETNKNQNMTSAVNFARQWRLDLLAVACSPRGHLAVVSPPHGHKSSRREWKPRRSDVIMTLWSDSQPDPCRCCRVLSKGHVIPDKDSQDSAATFTVREQNNLDCNERNVVWSSENHMCSPWANNWLSGYDNQAPHFFGFFFIFFIDHKSNFFLFCFVFNFGNVRAGHKTALFPEFRLNNWWRHKTFTSLKTKLLKRSQGNQCLWLEQAWCCVT